MDNYVIIIMIIVVGIALLSIGKYLLRRKSKVNNISNKWIIECATTHHADVNNPGQCTKIKKQIDQQFPWLEKIQSLIEGNNVEIIHGGGVLHTEHYYELAKGDKSKDRELFLYLIRDAKKQTDELKKELANIKAKYFDEKETLDEITDPSVIEWAQKEVYPILKIIEDFRCE